MGQADSLVVEKHAGSAVERIQQVPAVRLLTVTLAIFEIAICEIAQLVRIHLTLNLPLDLHLVLHLDLDLDLPLPLPLHLFLYLHLLLKLKLHLFLHLHVHHIYFDSRALWRRRSCSTRVGRAHTLLPEQSMTRLCLLGHTTQPDCFQCTQTQCVVLRLGWCRRTNSGEAFPIRKWTNPKGSRAHEARYAHVAEAKVNLSAAEIKKSLLDFLFLTQRLRLRLVDGYRPGELQWQLNAQAWCVVALTSFELATDRLHCDHTRLASAQTSKPKDGSMRFRWLEPALVII
mmetsp:Transcript_8710/g.19348  ORF Transcript_8710/g.19348 Transcript_8710/m.19348 type:complete len:287 (+) Transcript_8710:367-1227(+)